ncbi:PIN domain-containing protein [Candidatus Pacearchaeota archaeon]|nr:PIN domain-containing protein [Candidatus Pacearchaeota archaeon]
MGLDKSFFFDTYALYEVLHQNPNYQEYSTDVSIITTKLQLMELHYILLRIYGKEEADRAFERFKEFCVEIDDETIKQATTFRHKHHTRKLSYIDCIGYVLARKYQVHFLTGDEQFKDFDGVKFVK